MLPLPWSVLLMFVLLMFDLMEWYQQERGRGSEDGDTDGW